MWKTFDEYLRLTYGDEHWQSSTRMVYSFSDNDFKYRNYMKTENIYDADHRIIGEYYPIERNKNCAFRDFHILQEVYYNTGKGNRFGLQAWYLDSERGVPMLNVDYREDADYINEQREQTFRGILSWDRISKDLKLGAKVGYIHTWLGYDYSRDLGNGEMAGMIESRSRVNTVYGSAEAEYSIGKNGSSRPACRRISILWKVRIAILSHKAAIGLRSDTTRLESNCQDTYRPNGARSSGSVCR